jgi:hypothetical protein
VQVFCVVFAEKGQKFVKNMLSDSVVLQKFV